jgi:hypothetical protein
MADNITGEAAKAAYYFFLSLFPMILALFAFTGPRRQHGVRDDHALAERPAAREVADSLSAEGDPA